MNAAPTAIVKALYSALSTPGAVSASVHQHAPANTAYPMVIIGEIADLRPLGRAGDQDREARVSIIVLTQGEQIKPCTDLLGQVDAALDGKSLSVAGWIVSPMDSVATASLAEDGLGYNGVVVVKVFALKV